MAEQSFKGKLSHFLDVKEIEWKVYQFILLSRKKEVVFESPEFFFMGSKYQLVIRPDNDENTENDSDVEDDVFYCLFLRRNDKSFSASRKIEVIYTFVWNSKESSIDTKYKIEKKVFWDFKTSLLKIYEFSRLILVEQSSGNGKKWILTVQCCLRNFDLKGPKEVPLVTFFEDLNTLSDDLGKLLLSGSDSDVILRVRVQEKDFKAHRSILGSRSNILATACRQEIPESSNKVISIVDCDADAFAIFLKYLYSGYTGELSVEIASDLLKIAVKYSTLDLRSFCDEFLGSHLTTDTVCDIASAAQLYGEAELMSSVQCFFKVNIAEIFCTQAWVDLMKEDYSLANELLKGMAKAK